MRTCQSLSLEDQLKAGVRYIDLYCQHKEDRLYCVNSSGTNTILESEFDQIIRFLMQHGKETVIVSIQKITPEIKATRSFDQSLRECTAHCKDTYFFMKSHIPTLEEVKGKIVFIRRFQLGCVGIDGYSLRLLDRPFVRTILPVSINGKFEDIKDNLDKARSLSCRLDLYVTYCSGASSGAYPNTVADRINHKLHQHLTHYAKQRWGVVVMDFPQTALIDTVIKSNFSVSS